MLMGRAKRTITLGLVLTLLLWSAGGFHSSLVRYAAAEDIENSVLVTPVFDDEDSVLRHNVFYDGEQPVVGIHFQRSGSDFGTLGLTYEIYDFNGALTESGSAPVTVNGSQGDAEILPSTSDIGWYRMTLNLQENGQSLPLVFSAAQSPSKDNGSFLTYSVVPHEGAVVSQSSPFGLDVAPTSSNSIQVPELARLAQMAGISWIRDRMPMGEVLPAPDQPNYSRIISNADEFTSRNMHVLQVFTASPVWTVEPGQKMTDDLLSFYQFGKTTAEQFSGHVDALEIWNEEDIGSSSDAPPDHYAAVLKAVSLGLKAGDPNMMRRLGPLGRNPMTGNFADILLSNAVSPYLEGYDFHNYFRMSDDRFSIFNSMHKQLADTYGFEKKSLWLTETGLAYSRGSVPQFDTITKQQVQYVVQAYVKGIEDGVDKIFPFLLRPYLSGTVQFGFFRTDQTPFPAYSALATLTSKLGKAKLLGTIPAEGADVYVFDAGTQQVAVMWSTGADTFAIPGNQHGLHLYDAVGKELPLDGSTVDLADTPLYLTGGHWNHWIDKASKEHSAAAGKDHWNKKQLDVVLFSNIDSSFIRSDLTTPMDNFEGTATNWAPHGYNYVPGQPLPVELDVYNFSNKTKSGSIEVNVPPGFSVSVPDEEITVGPMSMQSISLSILPDISTNVENAVVSITGTFGNKSVTPSVWQVFLKSDAE